MSFVSLHAKAEPSATNAQLAQILIDNGAVFFNHTSLCQTIMQCVSLVIWKASR